MFVSAEAFLSIPAAAIDSLKDRLGARRARILIYVRDYPAWVVSLYAQHTKLGRNVRDFDSFMGVMSGQASIRKPLERWAQAFGDEAIRLRPLTPDSLAGGRLETDLLAALGIDLPVESRIRNAAPPWMALELQRAAAAAVREAGGADLSREGALALIRSFTAATPPDALRVQYLTPSHWRLLADSYDRDMETLGRRFGFATAPSGPPPPERLFLPQASEIPAPVLAAAAASLGRGKVAGRIDPASLGVIRARIGQLAADADRA